jgi:diaminohydroxyphosphoribosylaminopyrimidine deaminase/5-amino-6-(5-phosphoribosylamino)uracil reductase
LTRKSLSTRFSTEPSGEEARRWMARALELARRGEAQASPNPMVGAVLVRDGRVVGEGFHTYAGLRHAEVAALEAAGSAARGATLYVNLEPCCHTHRTGPCTEALLAAGVRRVVVAIPDPNPAVVGRGIRQLRKAGLDVELGVRQNEARHLNEPFARWVRTGRPLVTLKAALTLDGQIASPNRRERRITSEESRAEVQRQRHASDAVLTGIGTVLADDPLLTDRTGLPRRRPLLRVVLDSRLRLPLQSKLVKTAAGDVLVFTTERASSRRARALENEGVEVVCVPERGGRPDLRAIIQALGRREILSVLMEAGATLNWAALEAGVVDKMFLIYAPKVLGGNPLSLVRGRYSALAAAPALGNLTLHRFGPDFAVEGYFRDVYRDH